jgi:hypothetical protein
VELEGQREERTKIKTAALIHRLLELEKNRTLTHPKASSFMFRLALTAALLVLGATNLPAQNQTRYFELTPPPAKVRGSLYRYLDQETYDLRIDHLNGSFIHLHVIPKPQTP